MKTEREVRNADFDDWNKVRGANPFIDVLTGKIIDMPQSKKHSTTNHTPGPWQRVISRGQSSTYTRVGAGYYGAVAECAGMRPDPTENAANARLIAAAPDLLDSLEECLVRVEYETERTGSDYTRGIANRARAAIAKARSI